MSQPTRVAALADIPAGSMLKVQFQGRPVALYNVEGQLYATSDVCSHDEASLSEGELDGHEVSCPWHGARFDVRDGRVCGLPAVRPVKTYQVVVVDDEVLLSDA